MSVRDHEDVLVARLRELAPHLDGEPDPAFRAATRQRLVAMAAVRTPVPPASPVRRLLRLRATDPPRSSRRTRFAAGLAGAALTVTAAAGLLAVAAGAGPGDPLYGVKRGTEQTQLALAGDTRGQTLLEFASTRLDELAALGADAALAESTIAVMDRQTTEATAWLTERAVSTGADAPLDRLSSWAARQSADLAALRDDVPAPAVDDVDGALALLMQVTTRAEGLRGALGCATGPSTAGSDALGPVPALCLPAPAAPPSSGDAAPAQPGSGTPPQSVATPSAPAPAPVPAPSAAPAPPPPAADHPGAPAATPGRTTPQLPLPPVPVPRPGAPTGSTPPPLVGVPLPVPGLGVCLGSILQLGSC